MTAAPPAQAPAPLPGVLPAAWWEHFEDPDGYRAEIIREHLSLAPSAPFEHNRVLTKLLVQLEPQLPEGYVALVDTEWRLLVEGRVASAPRPDLMVVPDRPGPIEAPLLAVEVLSPSDHEHFLDGLTRIEAKRLDYASNGLEHYLEVSTAAHSTLAVASYRLRDGSLQVEEYHEGDGELACAGPFPYTVLLAPLRAPRG